jgi:hypothetical protein
MMSLKHRPAISLPATTKSKKRNNGQKDKTDKSSQRTSPHSYPFYPFDRRYAF